MTKTTAPQPDSASRSLPDCRHCDTVSNSSSASYRPHGHAISCPQEPQAAPLPPGSFEGVRVKLPIGTTDNSSASREDTLAAISREGMVTSCALRQAPTTLNFQAVLEPCRAKPKKKREHAHPHTQA